MERKPDTNAFVRTTTAVTMFNAGVKVQFLLKIDPNSQEMQELLLKPKECFASR